MIKTTRWSPDTCPCILEYTWDDSIAPELRVHTISNVVSRCSFHRLLVVPTTHYAVVLEENQRKNKVQGLVMEHLTRGIDIVDTIDGSFRRFKRGFKYNWSFDDARFLNIVLDGYDDTEKTQLRTLITTEGILKVNVA